jgi:hypothetical protein
VGDEDGDIAVFPLSKDRNVAFKIIDKQIKPALAEISMGNSVYSTPIVANNVLYIANKDHIFAITPPGKDSPKAGGE